MTVDIVIPTKDRYHLLPKAVRQAKNLANRVIVVDSTEHPNIDLLNSLQVDFVLTPNAKLGFARQMGLLKANTDYIAFLDDDIEVDKQWLKEILTHFNSPKVAAVSSLIIFYDSNHPELADLCRHGRDAGASGGVAVLDRNKVLSVGGWNENVHFGEDFELYMRLRKHGFEWNRIISTQAYHPITYAQWIHRGYTHGSWLVNLVPVKTAPIPYLLLRTFGSALIMPFFYLLRTKNFKVFKIYQLYKLNHLLGLLNAIFNLSKRRR